jgi:putative hemolysin
VIETAIYVISIVFFTYWSGFFSGSEIALFSLSSTKVRSYRSSHDYRKRLISSLLKQPRDLIVTIYIMNTLVNIMLQNVSSSMFGIASSWWLKVGVPLLITLILGEVIPKYIAMQKNESFSCKVVPLINFFTTFLRPVREWMVKITTPLSRVMYFFLKKEKTMSKDELYHVLKSSEQTGVLNSDETRLISGYINLQEDQVVEHMRPREDVIFYNINEPLKKLVYLFVEEECTRIPVCRGELDNVIGVLSANDFFLYKPMLHEPSDIVPIMTKPFFLPETTPARMLLKRFEEKNEQMALVVDEHRSVTGLITVEDIVEEVVGEITDRRDQGQMYEKANDRSLIANAKMELDDLEEVFGVSLESEHHLKTIGGWLIEQLGDIPPVGTKYETDALLFQVLAADPNRIKRIYITKKEKKNV